MGRGGEREEKGFAGVSPCHHAIAGGGLKGQGGPGRCPPRDTVGISHRELGRKEKKILKIE